MAICTFFGHRDCPDKIKSEIYDVIKKLVEVHRVSEFYVGNQGKFDILVLSALKQIKKEYPDMRYSVVLAYLPTEEIENSIYPEGLEKAPKKFCIDKRNRWMLKKSDFVVTYINRNVGGAAKYAELAKKSKKTVINLAEL